VLSCPGRWAHRRPSGSLVENNLILDTPTRQFWRLLVIGTFGFSPVILRVQIDGTAGFGDALIFHVPLVYALAGRIGFSLVLFRVAEESDLPALMALVNEAFQVER